MNHPLRTRAARRRVALTLAATLALPAALPMGTAGATHYSNTEELTAEDNVGAAIAYSTSTFAEPVEEVALGRDDTFPDSLASGMLQGTRPLLLTAPDALSEPTKEELARLQPTTVHVLGGEQAIQPAVVEALETEGYTVVRHAGPTRIDTAVEVAKNLGAAATQAIIARAFGSAEDESRAFADSLAAGGWAAGAAIPVLLTETEQLSEATGAYLGDSSITEVFVVGGEAAVSPQVVTQLEAQGLTVKRVSGPTRFHTALAIAVERGFATAADAEKVILTEGQAEDAWAAGFAAAARSAADNAPIVLAVGTEVPEPTLQFLNGGEEPGEDPEAQDPIAALLCGPKLAMEACDAAAIALGQLEGAGGELLEIPNTAVGRFDHVTGTLAEPKAVNGFHVTGCGYTNEPIFFEPSNGVFYLMLAGDPGVCSAEFSLTLSAGVIKQTVEFTVGEDFTPPSALGSPELVVVRPVKQDEEGVHLRFVFDEPIAPAPEIRANMFHLFDTSGKPDVGATPSLPSAVFQDPRNPRAVIAVFSATQYEKSTVAVARGGFVCAPGTGTLCDGDWPGRTKYTLSIGTNIDEAVTGAVQDIDRLPNPTGHFGVRTDDQTEGNSQAPDLISVGEYQATDQSLLFTFSEPVTVPAASEVGDATLLLKDGTIKSSDANGWRAGPTTFSLRLTFAADGLSAADMEQARRAIVSAGKVQAVDGDVRASTPTAVIIAGGGISDRPDFVNKENEQLTSTDGRKVTFVFEEDLFSIDTKAGLEGKFVAVLRNGLVAYPEEAPKFVDNNRRKVEVGFHEPNTQGIPTGTAAIDDTVLYYTVLTGAVTAFSTQLDSFADTIRVPAPVIFDPGETLAPDLIEVRATWTEGQASTGGLDCENDEFLIRYRFDAPLLDNSDPAPSFDIWHHRKEGDPNPNVERLSDLDVSGSEAVKSYNGDSTGCPTPGLNPGNSNAPEKFGTGGTGALVKYLSVETKEVQLNGNTALFNYAAGMAVPN